ARHDSRVVAGGEPVESHLQDARQHEVEPHEGVAPHAWIGRAAFEVVAVEGLDHPLPEILLQVPTVIRNAEDRRDTPRIFDRVERAATAMARRFFRVVARPLLQRDPDHVVALSLKESCSNRRVNAARHGDRDLPHLWGSTAEGGDGAVRNSLPHLWGSTAEGGDGAVRNSLPHLWGSTAEGGDGARVLHNVPRHDLRVFAHTVENGRLRLALEVNAHEIQAWHRAATIDLDRKTHVVEDGKVDPAVVRSITRGPDDCRD